MFPSTEAHTWGVGKPAQEHGQLDSASPGTGGATKCSSVTRENDSLA